MTMTPRLCTSLVLALSLFGITACTQVTNPATGKREFTALSPAEEVQVGKDQHPRILQQFGGEYDDPELHHFVVENKIGETSM